MTHPRHPGLGTQQLSPVQPRHPTSLFWNHNHMVHPRHPRRGLQQQLADRHVGPPLVVGLKGKKGWKLLSSTTMSTVMTISPGYGNEPRESQTWPSSATRCQTRTEDGFMGVS